ncbi:guanylate kinase [Anabaena sp. UHCC 0253]|uniref:guanylate kinase n=1 Tax=Anabaena sp. UHCC 0253 TaxID=2590019 RepID=UPI00144552E0|nr:guanylate kinase [Anabaena sp. UHCC 0253]MTJ55879.1 guanylate kinase [Anabaena sp. UHCC 0253]
MLEKKLKQLIVVTGTSGSGKTTLVHLLLERYPELEFSVSVTTRKPRIGEIEGKDYYFVSQSEFKEMIIKEQILQWVKFADNYYGTPRNTVENQIKQGKKVVMITEMEGMRKTKQIFPDTLSIFIMPPSLEVLKERIQRRKQDSCESIKKRLETAKIEIQFANECDKIIINDNLDKAIDNLQKIIFDE